MKEHKTDCATNAIGQIDEALEAGCTCGADKQNLTEAERGQMQTQVIPPGNETGISQKWMDAARFWVGNEHGKHCHWCKGIKHDDGESHCDNPDSKFFNEGRIRSWDGEECAKQCGHFKLSDFYKDDANYDKTFTQAV